MIQLFSSLLFPSSLNTPIRLHHLHEEGVGVTKFDPVHGGVAISQINRCYIDTGVYTTVETVVIVLFVEFCMALEELFAKNGGVANSTFSRGISKLSKFR